MFSKFICLFYGNFIAYFLFHRTVSLSYSHAGFSHFVSSLFFLVFLLVRLYCILIACFWQVLFEIFYVWLFLSFPCFPLIFYSGFMPCFSAIRLSYVSCSVFLLCTDQFSFLRKTCRLSLSVAEHYFPPVPTPSYRTSQFLPWKIAVQIKTGSKAVQLKWRSLPA